MLENFLASLDTHLYREESYLFLVETFERDDDLFLIFELRTADNIEKWEIKCINVEERCINDSLFETIKVYEEHVLLWKHNQPVCKLYFHGNSRDFKTQVVGDLYFTHLKTVGRWFPFGDSLNQYTHLLESGYGLLAEGPELLLQAYQKVLAKYDLNPSILVMGMPKRWGEDKWVTDERKYFVLLFDNSYIVATGFEATCKR